MLFSQLVCYGCYNILTYPFGAITCRCCVCNALNAAHNMQITCVTCGQVLHAPINTVSLLCPCCGTVTDIPEDLLPPLPSCINVGDDGNEIKTVIYVSHPTLPPRLRAESEANAGVISDAGSQSRSAHTWDNGQQLSDSAGRLGMHSSSREATTVPGSMEKAIFGDNVFAARDAEGAHRAGGKRRESSGPSTCNESAVASAVSEMPSSARLVTTSRLAPTVMIATRIL
ncbi:hypothetical protein JKF63_06707 [Porcisia hertigi]|uniref:Zinc finger LSD1-type domain-containing protein n=1 Tax=Porcisia hertigi TaxID=2761500 RepID=A0A836I108_9TRYP|nr:hypothetical protein JKF63_06707 [Porcisia hertigi]